MRRCIGLCLVGCAIAFSGACASRGREVFIREGCGNCHRFRELGSGGAPDLSDIGSRRGTGWIGAHVGNPAAHDPETRMPSFPHIRGFDLRSLVAFLRS